MTDDLWGDLPSRVQIETPYDLFREQASLLGEKTNGTLVGEVLRSIDLRASVSLNLLITAPALDNYKYVVLQAYHSVTDIYPVTVLSGETQSQSKCNNPEELKRALQTILRSVRVQNIVRGLLTQITQTA